MNADLSKFLAEKQIERKILEYCRGVDRKDFALVRSVYHEDAIDEHGPYNGGVDGLIDWMSSRHETVEQSMHLVGNILIDIQGDIALAETYCVTFQRLNESGEASDVGLEIEPGSVQTQVRCRYIDKFTKRGGEWKISHRIVAYDSTVVEPYVHVADMFSIEMQVSARDMTDPLYTIEVPF